MRSYISWFFLISMFAANLLGQVTEKTEPWLFVEVPRDVILPVVAVQPNCPIRFEQIRYLAGVKGGGITSYRLRNVGLKPIRRFIVATTDGSEFEWWRDSGELVSPGAIVPQSDDPRVKVVQLTDKLRTDLKFQGPMKGILVLMVVSVEFADGTKFSDEATYEGLKFFMDKTSEAMFKQEQLIKGRAPKPK